jgi:hypothetical protein
VGAKQNDPLKCTRFSLWSVCQEGSAVARGEYKLACVSRFHIQLRVTSNEAEQSITDRLKKVKRVGLLAT